MLHVISYRCVAVIYILLRPGHLRVRVGDSPRLSEEILKKIIELRVSMRLLLLLVLLLLLLLLLSLSLVLLFF